MQMKIIYLPEADQKPLATDDKQNHFIICDSETGNVYKATDVKLDASKIEFPEITFVSPDAKLYKQPQDDRNVIGYVDSGKMIFFENRKGPIDDLMTQMIASDLSPAERNRVLAAKTALDSGSARPRTSIKSTADLTNG